MTDRSGSLNASAAALLQRAVAGSVIGVRSVEYQQLSYTAYGFLPGMARNGQLAFNGQLLVRGVQGYLLGNGHRLYSPALMRFNSPDSLSPFGRGGINAFAYCGGDPVNFSDPAGTNRFAKYQAVFEPLFRYLQSSDRKQYRVQGFAYDPASPAGQRITRFRAKSENQRVMERPDSSLQLSGRFYVSEDRRLFINEHLVVNDSIESKPIPFYTQFVAQGFTLMDVNPTQVRSEGGKSVFDINMISVSDSGIQDHSQQKLTLPGLADAIRNGRQRN